jgi:hypothetical protein
MFRFRFLGEPVFSSLKFSEFDRRHNSCPELSVCQNRPFGHNQLDLKMLRDVRDQRQTQPNSQVASLVCSILAKCEFVFSSEKRLADCNDLRCDEVRKHRLTLAPGR